MLQAAHEEGIHKETIIYLAVMTGLRLGELHDLEWDAIDFEEKTLKVRQITQYVPGEGVISKEPKTSSKRTIQLADITVNLLREYRKYWPKTRLQMGDKWQIERDVLFFSADGKLPRLVTTTMWFSHLLERHSLPHIRFHDLRHTSPYC